MSVRAALGSDLDAVAERLMVRLLEEGSQAWSAAVLPEVVRADAPLLDEQAVLEVSRRLAARLGGLGPLDPFHHDVDVTDILVNGDGTVWLERSGSLRRTDLRLDPRTVELIIERVVGPLGLRVDRSAPIVDARLPDGSRVCVVLPPLSVDGPLLAIRRHKAVCLTLDRFTSGIGVGVLRGSVQARRNILVYGATGAGKTTLLNALAAHLGPDERVVTIEEAAELRLPGEHVVRLEARPPNAEGAGTATVRQLLRAALRLRPDRIIVGEVRGPEAVEMVAAMTTGHSGSLSTCHAASAEQALQRLETMILTAGLGLPLDAVRRQLGAALDVLIGVRREPDGTRRVFDVCELHTREDTDGPRFDLRSLLEREDPPSERI